MIINDEETYKKFLNKRFIGVILEIKGDFYVKFENILFELDYKLQKRINLGEKSLLNGEKNFILKCQDFITSMKFIAELN